MVRGTSPSKQVYKSVALYYLRFPRYLPTVQGHTDHLFQSNVGQYDPEPFTAFEGIAYKSRTPTQHHRLYYGSLRRPVLWDRGQDLAE